MITRSCSPEWPKVFEPNRVFLAHCLPRQTRVVLNCVGPYRFYGEQVVSACVDTATHHIDVAGEPQYLEKMQLKYNDSAAEKGIFIIGACGFDSIPCDVGQMLLTKKMRGDVNSIEVI